MAVRMVEVRGSDGIYHSFYASQCRDSSKLSALDNGRHWWGVRNDCNGFFSVHWGLEDATVAAAEFDAGYKVYVVPVVVHIDAAYDRMAGARIRARDMGLPIPA